MGSIKANTYAFCKWLLECADIDDAGVAYRYISGLKTDPFNWVRMMIGNELPTLQHAA